MKNAPIGWHLGSVGRSQGDLISTRARLLAPRRVRVVYRTMSGGGLCEILRYRPPLWFLVVLKCAVLYGY
jgi:hypothetical protein